MNELQNDQLTLLVKALRVAFADIATPVIPSLLIDAKEVGRLLAISTASVWRRRADATLPSAVALGGHGTTRWRRLDIERFVAWNCKDRREFETHLRVAR